MNQRLCVVLVVGLLGCGDDAVDLPRLQASSLHFRYFARDPGQVPSDIMDRLERSRADVYAYLGLSGDMVTHYYRLNDPDDLDRSSPCWGDTSCAAGAAVFTTLALDEHELIHTYVDHVGAPAPPISEGIAEALGCQRGARAPTAESHWERTVREHPTDDGRIYVSDQRLVKYLLLQHGVPQFVRYYKAGAASRDPALFALQFKNFWGVTIEEVWREAVENQSNVDESAPLCPCMLPPIASGGGVLEIQHPHSADYRPVAVAPGAGLLLEFGSNTGVSLEHCDRTAPGNALLADGGSRSLALIHLDSPRYFLNFGSPGVDSLTATEVVSPQPACADAPVLAIGDDVTQLSLAVPRLTVGTSSYIRLSSSTARAIRRRDPSPVGVQKGVRLCRDCSLTSCEGVTSLGPAAMLRPGDVLELSPDVLATGGGLTTASLIIE